MKAVVGIILTFLLGAMFVSLFHMSTGMDMTGGMRDCPFMSHEEVLCPMSLVDHLGAWKSAFLTTASTILYLFAAAGMVAIAVSIAPNFLTARYKPIPARYRWLRERVYTYSYRPLQELFSNGILHPKVF